VPIKQAEACTRLESVVSTGWLPQRSSRIPVKGAAEGYHLTNASVECFGFSQSEPSFDRR
jgi:hypothetical protein